jgi:hypothetical protein
MLWFLIFCMTMLFSINEIVNCFEEVMLWYLATNKPILLVNDKSIMFQGMHGNFWQLGN